MENQEMKEIIIQKQEKYSDMINKGKKAVINTAILTGISGAMAIMGISGMYNCNEYLQIYGFLAGIGTMVTTYGFINLIRALSNKYKFNIKKETIDELLESIEKEEKEKTL